MLEFYPMPTHLNGGLYAHHQHHGGARFLDNPATTAAASLNSNNCNMLNSNNTNNNSSSNNNNFMQQHQLQLEQQLQLQQQQQQQQHHQQHTSSPTTCNHSPTADTATPSHTTTTSPSSAAAATSSATTAAPTSGTPSSSSSASASSTSAAAAATTSATPPTSAKLSADCSGRTEVGQIKCEKNYEICEGCGQKIHDRYLMKVGDSNWHEQCLACCYCGTQLNHTCYVRSSKLYCKMDYERIFAVKCAACCHPVLPQELVMRPNSAYVFHLPCFSCYACRLPLQKGEQFLLRDGQLFCFRHDLEKELYLAAAAVHHCGLVGLGDEDDLMRPRDGRRGPKRPRTILTSQQRKQFKASFDQSPKPCRKVREALAKDTGLSVRVVQVWFQNQRAKMKKIQRKAKNGSGSANGNAEDKDKDKDEKSVKQESGSGSENGYLGLDSAFASQPLNPNLPFSPDDYPANSNDSFCSSDLSLDGSNFDQLDDDTDSLSLNNLDLQSTCSSGNQHSHGSSAHDLLANLNANLNTNLLNPINKLYQMQNSYFSSEQ